MQGIERGPGGAPGEEHVVDQDHDLLRDVGHLGGADGGDRPQPDVVAVERDVETPDRRFHRLEGGYGGRDAPGQRHAACVEADDHDVVGAVIALDDLVRDPGQRPAQIGGVEDVGAQDRIANTRLRALVRVSFAGRLGRHRLLLRRDLTGSPSRSERG